LSVPSLTGFLEHLRAADKKEKPAGLIAPAGQCLDDCLLQGSTRLRRHNRRMVMMVMAVM
jgi:hypothetical protein